MYVYLYAKFWTMELLIHLFNLLYKLIDLTFAAAETESQFPPARVNFPSPMRDRMSLGVSFGPFAKGVCL